MTEFLVLACDGIWDVKSSQDSIDFLTERIYGNNFKGKPVSLDDME